MGWIREFICRRAIECADYDGEGQHLYNMWLTDTEIIRCRDCKYCESTIGRTLEMTKVALYSCRRFDADVRDDGFCAWTERQEL